MIQLEPGAIKNLIQDESDDYEEPEVSLDELELAQAECDK